MPIQIVWYLDKDKYISKIRHIFPLKWEFMDDKGDFYNREREGRFIQ